ncbi:MAG: PAS domain S-box protein [Deltaproteobacteria bacterium]|nr:PAS domain S-box protein [Deltaproteobacteria bacterium]
MRLKLSQRFNVYVGGILILGIAALFYYDSVSNAALLKNVGLSEAERLSAALFDQIHTSMRLGGGGAENRATVERFRRLEGVDEIRLIHGPPIDAQYGVEPNESPADALDFQALAGVSASKTERVKEGYTQARYVMPLILKKECTGCHAGAKGAAAGAISIKISLKKYEEVVASHAKNFYIWGGGIVFVLSAALLTIVNGRLRAPLESLKRGAVALASGDLGHRVGLTTGDELEDLGRAFDSMAESLSKTTERLNGLNEKHSRLVQMAADAILLKDIEAGVFVEVNQAATELLGFTRAEFLGMRDSDIYPSEKIKEYTQSFLRWILDGKGYLMDALVRRKDGFTVPVEVAASVVDVAGKKYMLEIWRDLSERKSFSETINKYIAELEVAVKDRTFELNKSLKELEDAYARLKHSEQKLIQSAKMSSLGEMGAGIAHELNSPLAGILSITEALMNRLGQGNPNYHLLATMKDAAVRSKYIILDMLTYSRPAGDKLTPVYLNESVNATLALFASEIKTTSIEIVKDLDMELPKILGNKGRIMEVLLNIIKNARDAVAGTGKIYVSTRIAQEDGGGFAVVEIRDTGTGVPDEIKDKIFDPFFSTKQKGGGLNIGLGLSISQGIIKEHGGKIEVENVPEGGATFKVFLPLCINGR